MKNLTPLSRKMFYWDEIVGNKNLASRHLLQGIRPTIQRRVNLYAELSSELENIPVVTYDVDTTRALKGCYSNSDSLSKLKAKIIKKQNLLLRAECQYCNIGEPNTFDHYLPQVSFPEFAALSTNLVPCCSSCNTAKGEEWLDGSTRRVLSFYFDSLPNNTYLKCQIVYRNNIPHVNFTIDSNSVSEDIRNVVKKHYRTLNLFSRYRLRLNSEITDVLAAITPHVGKISRQQIQNSLTEESITMKRLRGANYWRAVIREGLANSDQFLTNSGF